MAYDSIEPRERAVQDWLEHAQLQWHSMNSHNFGWAHALSLVRPERRDYWEHKRQTLKVAEHRNAAAAEALWLQYLEPVYATASDPRQGIRDRRTSLALFKSNIAPRHRDDWSDLFEPEKNIVPIIFSCDGHKLCKQEEIEYRRRHGADEQLIKRMEVERHAISNESQRTLAINCAREFEPEFVGILEALAAAYPEPIYCPYFIHGTVWPFFSEP
jgi:hypothetical protein